MFNKLRGQKKTQTLLRPALRRKGHTEFEKARSIICFVWLMHLNRVQKRDVCRPRIVLQRAVFSEFPSFVAVQSLDAPVRGFICNNHHLIMLKCRSTKESYH